MEIAIMLTFKMIFTNRIPAAAGMLLISGCLTMVTPIATAQEAPEKVATAQRETLLQTTQSWNGKRYTHYPAGQPQLTTLKIALAAHTSCLGTIIPFPMLYMCSPEP
jgi:hypothetical protein